jgi:HSP20 family protein
MVTRRTWDPFAEFQALDRFMDRMNQERNGRVRQALPAMAVPFDLFEREGEYVLRSALPGIDPSQVNVSVERGVLTISGSYPGYGEEEQKHIWHFRGLPAGNFRITTVLPGEVNAEQAQAAYEQGLLSITLPKAESARPRRIQIQTAAPAPEALPVGS